MPVGLSPAAAPTIKFKSIAISVSYPSLSTLSFPPKAVAEEILNSTNVVAIFQKMGCNEWRNV